MNPVSADLLSAIEELASSLETAEISSAFSSKFGELCFAAGKTAQAEFFFEKAVALDAANADALNNLGVIHFQAGRYRDAENKFLEAARSDPGKTEATVNLSRLYSCVPELASEKAPADAAPPGDPAARRRETRGGNP